MAPTLEKVDGVPAPSLKLTGLRLSGPPAFQRQT